MRTERVHRLLAAAALLLAAAPAVATGTLELKNEVFQEIDVPGPDGRPESRTVPAARVVPGSEVVYVITYRNAGDEAAADVVITNPLPAETVYVAAAGPAPGLEVSVDGGALWGPLVSLAVAQPDGSTRPATPSDVTHLRWRLQQPVGPGREGQVSFRARLK